MFYNDGPEMDENLRITKCPRCANEIFDDDAEFCQVCGLSLFNYCIGQPIYDDYGNLEGHGEVHKNKGNARFCKYCGTETVYTQEGILREFHVVLEEARQKSIDDIPF